MRKRKSALQEKTKIVTEISVTILSQIMFSDGFVTEFSSSQYWSSLNFVTEKNSVTKFCDGFLTEIRHKIVTKIVSVTKKINGSGRCFRHKIVTDFCYYSVTIL